ncbi:hypothetical protein LPJ74_003594 [Coemansia sp. RSA 1843]|nr:hypothetical protein LPJ74_003594 [Coemansia sp. RSA 1843]
MDLNFVCAADNSNSDNGSVNPLPAVHELNNIKAALSGFNDQQSGQSFSTTSAMSNMSMGSQQNSTTPPLTASSDTSMFSTRSDHRLASGSTSSAPNSAPPSQQRFSQSRAIGALTSLAVGVAETVRTIQDAIHTPPPQHHGYASSGAANSAMKDSATSVFGLAASQKHRQPIKQEESSSAANNGDSAPTDSESISKKQANSILEKYRGELNEVAEKCKILSQFAEQYGPERNRFHAQPSDDLVIDMARKAYEVLMVFMTIRRERMSTSVDDDTMEYIRKRRTVLSPARAKSRKRSKRADAAQPNTCRSCGISETPEWRRGPDGARTLCNACGLHYAKLNKKRAHEATSHASLSGADSTDSTPPTTAIAASGAATAPHAQQPLNQQTSPPQALSSDRAPQASSSVSAYTNQQYNGNHSHMHPQSAGAAPHERKVFQPLFGQQQQPPASWQQQNTPVSSWQQQAVQSAPQYPPSSSYPEQFAHGQQQPHHYNSSENQPYYHRSSLPSIYSADSHYANNRQHNNQPQQQQQQQQQQQPQIPGQIRQQSASSISRIIG